MTSASPSPSPAPITSLIVAPHSVKSREVLVEDIPRVVETSQALYLLCYEPNGLYARAFAMHHSQIDDKDPLDFFVTQDKRIIINPVIVTHSEYTKDHKEACMTFGHLPPVTVQRWQKIVVRYVTVMTDPEDEKKFVFSGSIKADLSGPDAFMFQHEMDHGQAKYIYEFNK